MKKTKVIIPALAVLLLSTAASVTGTVAWFSMNNSVTVTGMTVTTKVSSNLLIAEVNQAENYQDSIQQARNGVLEPVSTVDGQSFFWTTSAKGNGDAKQDIYNAYSETAATNLDDPWTTGTQNDFSNAFDDVDAGKTHYDPAFVAGYGFSKPAAAANQQPAVKPCYGYIDYSFYIKATSAKDDQVIFMSKCNLLYNTAAANAEPTWAAVDASDRAWRVALLAGDVDAQNADPASLGLKSILSLNGAAYRNAPIEHLVENGDTIDGDWYIDAQCQTHATAGTHSGAAVTFFEKVTGDQAVNSTSSLGAVSNTYKAAAQASTDIDTGATRISKITVRLWLEGEDTTCTSTTYALLTSNWKLDLEFQLGDAQTSSVDNGVAEIGSVAA